jgi:hypothetical protein
MGDRKRERKQTKKIIIIDITVSIGSLIVDVDVVVELVPHFPSGRIPPLLPDVGELFPRVLVRGC